MPLFGRTFEAGFCIFTALIIFRQTHRKVGTESHGSQADSRVAFLSGDCTRLFYLPNWPTSSPPLLKRDLASTGEESSYMNTGKYICLYGLLLALLSPVPASADITFYVSPDSDNDFFIEGDNITETESVEITVVYDSTILANPRVSLEGGTVTNILYPNPGILTFKANRGGNLNHSFEAHLNFDRKWDSQGGLFSVTGKLMEPDGTISPSRTTLNLATSSLLTFASNDGEQAPSPEKSAATEAAAPSGNSPDLPMKSEKSVVQRFKEFRGERGLKAFVALFERTPGDILVQEPPVALSDGKTPVRITLSSAAEGRGIAEYRPVGCETCSFGERG